jgi:hypothetical protein
VTDTKVPELTPGSVRTINFTGKRLHHELITRRTINTAKQKALFRCEKFTNQVLINLLLHIFCIKAKKCPWLSFLTEAQPRLNRRGQKALFWQRCTLYFLGNRSNYKAKDIIGKLLLITIRIYIIYGDVGFVANILNRPTDGATVSVRKSAAEKELLFVRL